MDLATKRSILSNPAGWFFCPEPQLEISGAFGKRFGRGRGREALRQALAWQRWARRKKLREEVRNVKLDDGSFFFWSPPFF